MAMSQEPQAEDTTQSSSSQSQQVIVVDLSSRSSRNKPALTEALAGLRQRFSAWRTYRRLRTADKEVRLVQQWQRWGRFRRWRRSRPFAGSILLILSGLLVLWGPAMLIRLAMLPGSTIWAGILVGALLVIMGVIQLLVPAYSLITGAIGVVLALTSLIASSFGGFGIGMLLGIIGGALGVAWRPVAAGKRRGVPRSSLRTRATIRP
ncbi:MAG: hypothetical protein IRZ31_07515 [Thermogemmatispora sp.]|uniref:DUF6114 domain-containing protein n=1 Tax=Thermogemmatispora sp. TaxID=1968838 RepID=UPI0026292EA2|nr:DUF6114 domain-containing protein [Thermogemmatispora sp.]MBX5456735.1 hypothetical protein [Thermogemmatispora sp.]